MLSRESREIDQAGVAGTECLSKVAVIIPALNEEESLPLVLRDLPPVSWVIVVDNGSTDATARVAADCGATVVAEPQRGYGAACLRGLTTIRERTQRGQPAPQVVVFVDADYSDHPELLPLLVQPVFSGTADFVLGSRLLGEREPGAMPPQSVYGNKLACFLMRLFFGIAATDLGPFRAIDYARLCDLEMTDENFGWTIEMQIKAARAGLRTREIPVPYRRRVGTSKISGTVRGTVKAGYKILYTIAKHGLRRGRASSRVSGAFQQKGGSVNRPPMQPVAEHQPSSQFRSLMGLAIASACIYGAISLLSWQFDSNSQPTRRPIVAVLTLFGIAFVGYLLAIRMVCRSVQCRRLMMLIVGPAIVFRVTMLFSLPILEVDIYRYMWDGSVSVAGINPFRYSPLEVRRAAAGTANDEDLLRLVRLAEQDPALNEILRRVHFGELPTIYPPTSQAVFAGATLTTPSDVPLLGRLFIMKAWFIGFDIATLVLIIGLLKLCGKPVGLCLIYAWCPLLIKEVANSGHLDAVAVFLTTLSVYLAVRLIVGSPSSSHVVADAKTTLSPARTATSLRDDVRASFVFVVLALAVGAKLYPIVLAPLLLLVLAKHLGWRRLIVPAMVFAATTFVILWPMLPRPPANLSAAATAVEPASPASPAEPAAAWNGGSPGSVAAGDPSRGVGTFLRYWEMNDFIFLIVVENLKPASETVPEQAAWFSVVPESVRESLVNQITRRTGVPRSEAAFLFTRVVTGILLLGLALWFACRAARRSDVASFCEAGFLTLAWFWLLCPTQNPWYWTWTLPLLPFARGRAWLAVSGLVLVYYLRFWFRDHWSETPVCGTGYVGSYFFDFVVTWFEFAPWFVWLAADAKLIRCVRGGTGKGVAVDSSR